MPVQECERGGTPGFKWGSSGVCFTGSDARARAAAVGRAIKARGSERTTRKDDGPSVQHEIEVIVAGFTPEQLITAVTLLPAAQLVEKADRIREDGQLRRVWKADDEKHLVTAEVYCPDFPDAHGDFMTRPEIEKMAYRFMAAGLTSKCDVKHNHRESGAFIVESYIARDDDPLFIPGAWVVTMFVPDDHLWGKIKSGEFNGFSMSALVRQREVKIDLELPEEMVGQTESAPNDSNGGLHSHTYRVRFDENGQFLGGETSFDAEHDHAITRHSVTDPTTGRVPGEVRHRHRFTFADALFGNRTFEEATGRPGAQEA